MTSPLKTQFDQQMDPVEAARKAAKSARAREQLSGMAGKGGWHGPSYDKAKAEADAADADYAAKAKARKALPTIDDHIDALHK